MRHRQQPNLRHHYFLFVQFYETWNHFQTWLDQCFSIFFLVHHLVSSLFVFCFYFQNLPSTENICWPLAWNSPTFQNLAKNAIFPKLSRPWFLLKDHMNLRRRSALEVFMKIGMVCSLGSDISVFCVFVKMCLDRKITCTKIGTNSTLGKVLNFPWEFNSPALPHQWIETKYTKYK